MGPALARAVQPAQAAVRSGHHSRKRAARAHHHHRVPLRAAARQRRHEERVARARERQARRAQERAARQAQHEAQNARSAATIAAVLATPCANTELTPTEDNLDAIRAAVLCLINRERAEHSELPLSANGDLQAAADSHDRELISDDYFAHVSPRGETPVQRIRETGYIPNSSDGYVLGENLAWGTYGLATPSAIVEAWIASPGHLANILEAQYRETGIAIVAAVPESLGRGAPGATYAQEFGVIIP